MNNTLICVFSEEEKLTVSTLDLYESQHYQFLTWPAVMVVVDTKISVEIGAY